MSNKPRILILTDWFTPGFKAGGPIRSVQNLVDALKNEVDFSILTSDRDLLDANPYHGIEANQWIDRGGYRVMYLSPERLSHEIRTTLESNEFDKVYLNSFFSVAFTLKPLLKLWKLRLLSKVILAPRGMLGEGALSIKPRKKKLFLFLFKSLGIHRRIAFHSTDVSETKSIQAVLGQVKLTEVMNIPVQVAEDAVHSRHEPLRIIFASRISPKKNLHLLLELATQSTRPFELNVFGAADDQDYYDRCLQITSDDGRIRFHGAVTPEELKQQLEASDLCVLPTRNENFGHSIIEALAVGTPVIISDQTPWNDLEAAGAGWVIPLQDHARWASTLELATHMPTEEFQRMSQQAQEYVRGKFDFEELRKRYKTLFGAQN